MFKKVLTIDELKELILGNTVNVNGTDVVLEESISIEDLVEEGPNWSCN